MRLRTLLPLLLHGAALPGSALAQLPEPLVPRVDVETLGWELELEGHVRTGSEPVVALGRCDDRDGDGLSELVIELGSRVSVHGSVELRRLELRGGATVESEHMASGVSTAELPPGRFHDPAWNPSGSFGAAWLAVEVDDQEGAERLVAAPDHTSTGAEVAEGALHLFREDGTRLASLRGGGLPGSLGLGRTLTLLDSAADGQPARVAAGDGSGHVLVLRAVRASHPSARVRLEGRSYPSLLGSPVGTRVPDLALLSPADLAPGGGGLEELADGDSPLRRLRRRNGQAVLLQVIETPRRSVGRASAELLAAARTGFEESLLDGYWLRAAAPEVAPLLDLRRVVGEDGLLFLEDGSGEVRAEELGPLLNGVLLRWSVGREPARGLEARLRRWEDALRAPSCVAVDLDLEGVDPERARLAWTWLLARNDGVLRGLPGELEGGLAPGRLGRPVEAFFHDESGTIQRDFEHGRTVSTEVSWAWTRVRMDGPHRSLRDGHVAWEHIFRPASSDVLLDLSSQP